MVSWFDSKVIDSREEERVLLFSKRGRGLGLSGGFVDGIEELNLHFKSSQRGLKVFILNTITL